jgi:predicted lipid-binding transport protein (Tim44 family)
VSASAPSGHRRPARNHRRHARELPPESLQSRRAAAARVRRRRLLVGDLLLGLLLGLIGFVLAPGLAVLAIGALVVLLACGVWGALHARKNRLRRKARTSMSQDTEALPSSHGDLHTGADESFGSY